MPYRKIKIALAGFLFTLLSGCFSESAESLYEKNDALAKVIYHAQLKSTIENKCISCHVFHLEGTNRYDNYDKTKSSIAQIIARININDNSVMPPASADQLTQEETLQFEAFYNALYGNDSKDKVSVTWTAFKYPDFLNRAPVSGTFDDLSYKLNQNYSDPIDILSHATITIETASVNVGDNAVKTNNVGVFFNFFSDQITGTVDSYTDQKALITFNMNSITQQLAFDVTIQSDKIILEGRIPDLNFFNWQSAYHEFDLVCGEFHQHKLWEDVSVTAEILF